MLRVLAAITLLGLACAEPGTVCPTGTAITRHIYSGGAESDSCRRDDGVRQGPEVRYYENGFRMVDGEYLDGVQHGTWRYYFNQGTVWRAEHWEDGALLARKIDPRVATMSGRELAALGPTTSGIIKLASADPHLGREARQGSGGQFVGRYPDGHLWVAGRYDGEGLRTGTWRFWYDDGHLAREVDYDAGVRHRAFREWHPSGAAKTDGFYMQGEPEGRWRRWDPEGHLIADQQTSRAMLPP